MFRQMTIIEHNKIFKRAILWAELALLALGIAVIYTALFVILQNGESGQALPPEELAQVEQILTWPMGLVNTLDFAAGSNLGGLLVIVLVGALTAQEYTWRTLQLWLSRGIPRPMFLGSKFVAFLLPALLIVLTPLLVGGAITAIFSQHLNGAIPFDQVAWAELGWGILLTTYTLLPYAALTFFLAVASRSTIVAIGGGLTFVLVLEGLAMQMLGMAGGMWTKIGQYMPSGLSRSLLETNSGIVVDLGTPIARHFVEPGTAAIGIACYVLTLVGLAILIFRRQDLGG